jgi:hypothetical protein
LFKKVHYDKPKPNPKPEQLRRPEEALIFHGLLKDRPNDKMRHIAVVLPPEGYLLAEWDYMAESFELLVLLKSHFDEGITSYQTIKKRFPQITQRRLRLRLSWLWAKGFLVEWARTEFPMKVGGKRYRDIAGIGHYGVHYQVAPQRITDWKQWSKSLKVSNEPQP